MKVLIIKTGSKETFSSVIDESRAISLGDVLRTTVILNLFKNDQVDWFTHESSASLLRNEFVNKLFTDFSSVRMEWYDTIVSLENNEDIIKEVRKLVGKCKVCGFIKKDVLLIQDEEIHLDSFLKDSKENNHTWSKKLFSILGKDYFGEKIIPPKLCEKRTDYQIGLNWMVGSKWPTKQWGATKWEKLYSEIGRLYKVSWQKGAENLEEYIDWINSCEIIITQDSLGLHLAKAFNKKTITLFGPTDHSEFEWGEGEIVLQADDDRFEVCMPCNLPVCNNGIFCMDNISVENVLKKIFVLMG